jgi:hypothetical protein
LSRCYRSRFSNIDIRENSAVLENKLGIDDWALEWIEWMGNDVPDLINPLEEA